jgi:hypothetical protein
MPSISIGASANYPSGQSGLGGSGFLPPLGPAHHHIDLAAPALAARKPLSPIRHGRLGAVALGELGRIGLDLAAAIPAPHDEANASGSGGA